MDYFALLLFLLVSLFTGFFSPSGWFARSYSFSGGAFAMEIAPPAFLPLSPDALEKLAAVSQDILPDQEFVFHQLIPPSVCPVPGCGFHHQDDPGVLNKDGAESGACQAPLSAPSQPYPSFQALETTSTIDI